MRRVLTILALAAALIVAAPATASAECAMRYDSAPPAGGGRCAGAAPALALGGLAAMAAAGLAAGAVYVYGRGDMTSIGRAFAGGYRGMQQNARGYEPTRNRAQPRGRTAREVLIRAPRAGNGEDFLCAVTSRPGSPVTIPCRRWPDGTAMRFNPVNGRRMKPGHPQYANGFTRPEKGSFVWGHKPGHEWRHFRVGAWRNGWDRGRVKAEQGRPDIWQLEVPRLGHGHEWNPSYLTYWQPPPGYVSPMTTAVRQLE